MKLHMFSFFKKVLGLMNIWNNMIKKMLKYKGSLGTSCINDFDILPFECRYFEGIDVRRVIFVYNFIKLARY